MTGRLSDRAPAFLYLGGSYPQRSAIQSLRDVGLFVAVTDRSAIAPAGEIADRFAAIDATDCDDIVRLADDLARERPLLGAYGVADYAFPSVAAVARRHSLKGPRFEGQGLFTDKALTSKRLRACGVPVPDVYWSGDASAAPDDGTLGGISGRDIVIKPRDSHNSLGVTVLRSATPDAMRREVTGLAAMSRGSMIEAFHEGRIGNVDGLVIDGEFNPISTTVRLNDPDRPTVCTAMIQPAGLAGHNSRGFDLAQRAAAAIGYQAGPITLDVVIGDDGSVHVLEVSPHYHAVSCEIARGNGNPMAAYGAWLLGRSDWRRHLPSGPAKHGVCYRKFVDAPGIVTAITGLEQLVTMPGFVDAKLLLRPGDRARCSQEHRDLLCLVWATADSRDALDRIIEHIEHEVRAELRVDAH